MAPATPVSGFIKPVSTVRIIHKHHHHLSCAKRESTNTGWHINAHHVENCAHMSVKLNIMGIWEWGIYGLMGGAFRVWLRLKWVGQLWQRKLLFRLETCSKNAGLQRSTLSDNCMTTGFGPFELPTCELLQRGRDHSPH